MWKDISASGKDMYTMTSNKSRGHTLVAVTVLAASLVAAATMILTPTNVIASTQGEGEDDSNGKKNGRDKGNNGNKGNGSDKNDEEDSGDGARRGSDNNGDDDIDDNVAFTGHTESTINGEKREDRDVKSNENSRNAEVEISHELTHTVQSGGAAREPAHEGKITFSDDDGGEVIKEINSNSAPQSAGAGGKISFEGSITLSPEFD